MNAHLSTIFLMYTKKKHQKIHKKSKLQKISQLSENNRQVVQIENGKKCINDYKWSISSYQKVTFKKKTEITNAIANSMAVKKYAQLGGIC